MSKLSTDLENECFKLVQPGDYLIISLVHDTKEESHIVGCCKSCKGKFISRIKPGNQHVVSIRI
jgi:hypothetical protein